jgi:phosphoglycolate phosphatase
VIAGTLEVVVDAIKATFPALSEPQIRQRVGRATREVEQVEAVPLRALMRDLSELGLALGIATNDAEATARAHLEAAGILHHLAFISGYDSGNGAKPGPGMLHAFCLHTAIAPAECVMIGDSLHDLASGRAAGMRTIGVLTGVASAEDLEPLADAILPNIGALPDWIGAQQPVDAGSGG